ncbi:MAG: exodeoxyribonuclease VII large subunit [Nitrospirae bacterium]|nr:exodeoxyribonuclease VII large subunit [Nitrospirota bacterium]
MTGGKRETLSVSGLTHVIKTLLEGQIGYVWIEGEISNFKAHFSSGHLYFSLKDDKAQIKAVMFRQQARAMKFQPADGQKVVALGRISVYEPRGEYQLVIDRMEPAGIGELQLAFLQLREKLEKEGLFTPERKRPIPSLPRRVGVVTSPGGAAIRDFLNVARRRFANIDILVSPASVQGDAARFEIASAIGALNRAGGIDVIVVTRGGGSIEDLWAFNTEEVARAIAASAIPVISAVGHEVDFTIADFVADLRAPTPSAAAEILVKSKEEFVYRLASLRARLEQSIKNHISRRRALLASETRAMPDPVRYIRERAQRVDEMTARMEAVTRNRLALTRKGFENLAGRLSALNPLAVLNRGYAIVSRLPDRKPVTSASQVKQGDRLDIRLRQGNISAEVIGAKWQESLFGEEGQ